MGNHEYYGHRFPDIRENYRNQVSKVKDAVLLEKDSLIIDNVRFLGTTLWSDLSNPMHALNVEHGLNDFVKISIKRDIDDTVYESANGATVVFEMPFTQNATERKTIALNCSQFQKIVLVQDWGNTTGSSVATTATAYKFATVPVAS